MPTVRYTEERAMMPGCLWLALLREKMVNFMTMNMFYTLRIIIGMSSF